MSVVSESEAAGRGINASRVEDGDGVSLLDLIKALNEQRLLFGLIWVLGVSAALAYALTVQRFYSATTVILPPQQQQSAAASALAQLGALSGVAGLAAGSKSSDELYLALLRSRSLQDDMIKRLGLLQRYEVKTMTDARMVLSFRVSLSSDKKAGLITIAADDPDAAFAAKLANAHVDALRNMLASLAVTEAQQRRMFFEQQVRKTQADLDQAELTFRKVQAQSGMVVTQALAESGIKAGVDLRAQIASREVQLQAMSRFATERNPEMMKLAAELGALRQQLNRLEGGEQAQGGLGTRGFAAVKAYREMKVQEAALEALIKQFEIAKMDESRDGPLLQQVDVAVPPEYPTKPKRSNIVIAGAAIAALCAAAVALWRAMGRRGRSVATVA
ncbi:MAG: Wzz/FepE/Etk N-terminal domain-containing protein [Aquabacterium sp.]